MKKENDLSHIKVGQVWRYDYRGQCYKIISINSAYCSLAYCDEHGNFTDGGTSMNNRYSLENFLNIDQWTLIHEQGSVETISFDI